MPAPEHSRQAYRSPWGESPEDSFRRKRSSDEHPNKIGTLIAVIALLLLVGGGTIYFYFFRIQSPEVGLEFSRPSQVLLGAPFDLVVSSSNRSDNILKNARLSLFLPEEIYFLGQPQGQRVTERAVGDLGPGSINKSEPFKLIVTGGSNSLKRIQAKLSYSSDQGSETQFESAAELDFLVGQPAISLAFDAPQSIFNGQDFEIKVDYKNDTNSDFKNLRLKIDYPPVFKFRRSTVKTELDSNNSWDLGTLSADSGGTISVAGSVVAPEKSFFSFSGSLLADFLGSTYTINAQTVNIAVSTSPLSLDIEVNNDSDYTGELGDFLTYILTYRNNSSVVMRNVTISSKLMSEMFDLQTLKTDASFNSLTNTTTWFAANTPKLANISPGQSGTVKFTVQLKEAFPVRFLSDKNYTLKIQALIESPTVPQNTTAQKTISVANLENKIAGRLEIASEAFWRDAASGILNVGPYPPKINQPTQYTIHWKIRNYATDVSDITVSAFLRSGSRFTGNVKSNIEAVPTFNPSSGLVTWTIPSMQATKGVISVPVEAIFQIETTPALNQVGQNIPILGETKIEGTDLFVNKTLQDLAPELDSRLPYDTTILIQDRKVQE